MMFATAKGWSGNRGTFGLRTSSASAFRVLGLALMLGLACGQPATAATSTIGRTWPIAEPDAMTEIEARAAKAPSLASRLGPRSSNREGSGRHIQIGHRASTTIRQLLCQHDGSVAGAAASNQGP